MEEEEFEFDLVWERRLGFTERNIEQVTLSPSGMLCGVVSNCGLSKEQVIIYDVISKKKKWSQKWKSRQCSITFNSSDSMISVMLSDRIDICDVHTSDILSVVPLQHPKMNSLIFCHYTVKFITSKKFYDVRSNPATLIPDTIEFSNNMIGLSSPPLSQYCLIEQVTNIGSGMKRYRIMMVDMHNGVKIAQLSSPLLRKNSDDLGIANPVQCKFNEDNSKMMIVVSYQNRLTVELNDIPSMMESICEEQKKKDDSDQKRVIELRPYLTKEINHTFVSLLSYQIDFFSNNTNNDDSTIVLSFYDELFIWNLVNNTCVWKKRLKTSMNFEMIVIRYPKIILCSKTRKCVEQYNALPLTKITFITQHWCRLVKFSLEYFPSDLLNALFKFI